MGRTKTSPTPEEGSSRKIRPALTPEGRMNQLTSLAIDGVEKRLINGTASAAEYVHFLKLASLKEKKELEKLELEKQLLKAKTDNLKSQKSSEELYARALQAMNLYAGKVIEEEDEEEDVY